ncbi:mechanosensitive ion channel family protein [Streptomyces griseiscabiei]|uniref:Uncharacterized protein n=2 Tax=Streptomyces griseiscabiei TaxID=2993540 RepID=A0ABU4LKN3_9ACTN|nr:hypothetical protein [Streptomyces griseiscabiei]MDX2915810.1 hypothetical protein [Streptomyces griseiscabiei]
MVSLSVDVSVDLTRGLNDAWSKVAQFAPKLAAFLVILVVGWIVAKLVARVLDRLLRRLGSERLSERAGTSRLLRDSSYDLTGILRRVVYYALMLMTLQFALGVFGANPVSALLNDIVAWLPRAVVAVVLVVVAMAVANAVRGIVGSALASLSYGRTLATGVWACVVGLGVIAALGQAQIAQDVTRPVLYAALGTVAGILVVGVGGGLIGPMRQRWERMLTTVERETVQARGSVAAYRAGREEALRGGAEGRERVGAEVAAGPGSPRRSADI